MIQRLHHLWEHQRLALMLFGATLLIIGYFGVKTISSTIYWMDPKHQNQPIKSWMTPRYVANSYDIPPFVLGYALLKDKDDPKRRMSMGRIALGNGLTLPELQERITTAAQDWHANPDRDAWIATHE